MVQKLKNLGFLGLKLWGVRIFGFIDSGFH